MLGTTSLIVFCTTVASTSTFTSKSPGSSLCHDYSTSELTLVSLVLRLHHEFSAPFGLAAEYAHPIEIMVLGIGTVGGPLLWCWASGGNMHLITMVSGGGNSAVTAPTGWNMSDMIYRSCSTSGSLCDCSRLSMRTAGTISRGR